ncbi:shikimate dehydrogenase [Nocardioides guangzhouensis]|uniref:Shikimate dehydrogenase n=1 Tax=Nocardioides guangzhouensis TaxID=2497878 RepID=A0A4Q4ZDJ2_9ACTN|nr:shikimate dehydrogenase [Nocardioides guangzhouensis]RYP86093.1 shikimate dehydrogenase [Nocardioides guangzhouensis]
MGNPWCAVLGDPIGHSLSPVLHRAAYRELGLDWTYDAYRVDEAGLPAYLDSLDADCRGLSLTMPLKRAVVPLADDVSDLVRTAGAANTLVLHDGRRTAENTDVPGAANAIRETYDGRLRQATIWGGGATAAALLLALAGLGCRRFSLQVRDPQRARETLAAAERHGDALGHPLEVDVVSLGSPVTGDVLVSTIPADAQSPGIVAAASAADVAVVFEVLYHPWPTPLAAAALGSSTRLVTGLDLLVHQAALQCELFTGRPAPLTAMRRAGESALAAR